MIHNFYIKHRNCYQIGIIIYGILKVPDTGGANFSIRGLYIINKILMY